LVAITQNMFRAILHIILVVIPLTSFAQDVEQVIKRTTERLKDQPIQIHGQFQIQGTMNQIRGLEQRIDPFSLQIQANTTLDILGVQAPFQFTYCDGNTLYRLPSFLITGISPHYRNFTLHAGDRSMYFSDYTLAGHGFRGIGFEYQKKDGGWFASTFYGRLKRSFSNDMESRQSLEPSFKRMGYGFKTGYQKNGNEIALSLLHVRDRENDAIIVQSPGISPAENVVLDIQIKKQFGPKWKLEGEVARSLLNRDARQLSLESGTWDRAFGLFTPNTSFEKHIAWKAAFNYKIHPRHQLDFYIDHVDPGFRSLGALFFQNDFERIGIRTHHALAKQKILVNTDLGSEKNNLRAFEGNRLQRLRGSLRIQWQVLPQWLWAGNYSNIRQTNKLYAYNNPALPVDSIFLAITNQQAQVQSVFQTSDHQHNLTGLIQYQDLQQIDQEKITDQTSSNRLISFQYGKRLMNDQAMLSINFTWNKNQIDQVSINSWSPGMIWNHRHRAWTYSIAVIPSIFTGKNGTNQIWSSRIQCKYQLSKKQYLQLAYRTINRSGSAPALYPVFSDQTAKILYQFQF